MNSVSRLAHRLGPAPQLLALVAAITGLASGLLGRSFDPTIRLGLVHVLAAVGLYVFAGTSGVIPFGQVAFMAVGAYAASILTMPAALKAIQMADAPRFLQDIHLPTILATIVAGLVAALFATVVGAVLMRMSGLTAGLASFAVLVMVQVGASNWTQVTRGTAGITGVPRTTTALTAFAWVAVAVVMATAFMKSRSGLRLRASREDEVAARSLGIGVFLERSVGFALSAFLMGVAGALFAQQVGSFQPSALYLDITFLLIAMLIVGGFTSLSGAIVGSLTLTAVSELLRQIEKGPRLLGVTLPAIDGVRDIGLAVVMLLVLLLRPRGIVGAREFSWTSRHAPSTLSTDRSVKV